MELLRKFTAIIIFSILLANSLLLTGCFSNKADLQHKGPEFVLSDTETSEIVALDKDYLKLIKNKAIVRIKGNISYQCKIKGAWAFVNDNTGLVFVDFLSSTPNILLPTRVYKLPIIIEGSLKLDNTVINNYHLIPNAYEYVTANAK